MTLSDTQQLGLVLAIGSGIVIYITLISYIVSEYVSIFNEGKVAALLFSLPFLIIGILCLVLG